MQRDFPSLREEQQANGVAASLDKPVFDQDLYGAGPEGLNGYDASIGVAETEEDMDEREAAVRRYDFCPAQCCWAPSAFAKHCLLRSFTH